ncbi:MAG: hypothetical protein HY996_00675 [Micrococcales bacterium]|nr:hypothetical protein [Micrococcales bacterium]
MSTYSFPPGDPNGQGDSDSTANGFEGPLGGYPDPAAPPADYDGSPVDDIRAADGGQDAGQGSATGTASAVAGEAQDAAKHVAGTAKDEAAGVVQEAKSRTRDLYHQTTAELRDQAGTQQQRVAEGLRTVGQQLGSMADSGDQGVASDVVRQASQRVGAAAQWLESRDPGSLLSELRRFASRRPGTFIAVAAVGGVVAGRLTKSLVENARSDSGSSAGSTTAHDFDGRA